MKKFLFLAALPLMLAACGDDNDEPKSVTLEYPEISVDYKATVKNKGEDVQVAVTTDDDSLQFITLGELQPHHWTKAYPAHTLEHFEE